MTYHSAPGLAVTVLHVQDCPSVAVLLERLAMAASLAQVSVAAECQLVRTIEEACRLGFRGSPTLLIDGRDPFPESDDASLRCRLYPVDGSLDGAPSISQLTAALLVARSDLHR